MSNKDQRKSHFREAMAAILSEKVEFPLGSLVTVVDAALSSTQQFAKVVLSVMPTNREEDVLDALQSFRREINEGMSKSLKLRKIPKIYWEFDRTEAEAEDIEIYIERLKREGKL